MHQNRLAPSVRRTLLRTCALGALVAPALLAPAIAHADFDADRDNVVDSADAFPCDASATSVIFAPAQGHHGFMLFEDQWPDDTDFDFNDVALTYNYIFQVNNAGQVVKMKATLNALAVGGIYDSGVGLQIPVNTTSVASVTKTIGSGAPVALTPVGAESQLTLQLSPNVRELFGGQANQINSDPTRAPMQGETMVVEITFNTPQTIDTGAAPFDLYIFRSATPSHEIHRPEFHGTRAMDQSLFGRGNDGSGSGRNFVDKQGLPYALNLPEITDWPKEGKPISNIFPNIVNFASSGGRTNSDFYRTGTVSTNMYAPPSGLVRPEPRFIGPDHVPAETGCVQAWGLAVDFGSSRNQFAYGSTMFANQETGEASVFVTGYVQGAISGFTSAGGLDIFVAKYDAKTGAELWIKQFGSTSDETGRDIAVDVDGSIYITGETRSNLDGTNAGGSDAFLMKLDGSGNLTWTRQLGGSGQDTGYGVAINTLGDVFIGGGTTSTNLPGATYPGHTPSNFLAKYSSAGVRQWATQYLTDSSDPSNYSYTMSIAVDPTTNDVYATGAERRYNRDAAAAENQFLTKLNGANGSVRWTQHIGDYGYNHGSADSRYAYAYNVSVDDVDGSAYVAGSWYAGSSVRAWGQWNRTAGDVSADATIVKYGPSGDFQWTYTLASTDGRNDYGETVLAKPNAGRMVYLGGRTEGALPGQTNRGGSDYFVAAYDYTGASRWTVQNGTTANDVGHVAVTLQTTGQANEADASGTLYIVGNTTGALGGTDQGHWDVDIAQYNYRTGAYENTVVASKIGWQIDPTWGACSVSCGGGTQTRAVTCRRGVGNTVLPDSYCVGSKPATSQSCNTQACFTYSWSTGAYGSCSASCGGGTQTRAVTCLRSDGQTVADSFCSGAGAKPGTTQSCNTQACYTYNWYSGAWSTCSASCGSGSQSRTVYCQRSDAASVADSYCTGTKPVTSQSCYGSGSCAPLTFTTCGNSGGSGPSQVQCNSAYSGTSVSVSIVDSGRQAWTVPVSGTYHLEVWGAEGTWNQDSAYMGGLGGYAAGDIYLNAGEVIYVSVGQFGVPDCYGTGGWNGGGRGGGCGGGGGGATDIRRGGIADANRIIVAGGGGGGDHYQSRYSYSAGGQSNPTYLVSGSIAGQACSCDAGGGGGYQAGTSCGGMNPSGCTDSGGGGGSSYVGGVSGGTMTPGVRSGGGQVVITRL